VRSPEVRFAFAGYMSALYNGTLIVKTGKCVTKSVSQKSQIPSIQRARRSSNRRIEFKMITIPFALLNSAKIDPS
jgi:hypothetical protein